MEGEAEHILAVSAS